MFLLLCIANIGAFLAFAIIVATIRDSVNSIITQTRGWITWFAWRPVKTEHGEWTWLRPVKCYRHCGRVDYFYTKQEYVVAKLAGKLSDDPFCDDML